MNILVINGSPKGDNSVTLQTCLYLKKSNPCHSFTFFNAASGIRQLEEDFSPAAELIEQADLLLFSYPVYTFLAPSQLHRFIELMKARRMNLSGKFATQITTSKHFYDVTAHSFLQENCQNMGLKFIKGLSADMDDLLTEKGRREALAFFEYVDFCVTSDLYEPFPPVPLPNRRIPVTSAPPSRKKPGTVVALVTDLAPENTQLAGMIRRFTAVLPYEVRLVNLRDFPFQGGCVGCFHCAKKGVCIYRDGFTMLLRKEIQSCNAIVLAFSIRDHSMGSRFKLYDDRQFCNGHRTVTMGKPFGYLISGNYSQEPNLQLVINGRAEVGGNFLAGTATDEFDTNGEIDTLCRRLEYAIENKYVQSPNFLGVGGMKIFRDLIWLMQGMMKADHRFFKAHGQYDFPQKKPGTVLKMYLAGALLSRPKLFAKFEGKFTDGMLAPYRKVLQDEDD